MARSAPRRRSADVAVIGGGVVGMSIAYGLLQRGLSVLVLDEGDVAFRASRGNFALVWVQGKGQAMTEYALWSLRSADLWAEFAGELEEATGIGLGYSRRGGFMAALSEAELDARCAALSRLHNREPGSARVERLDRSEMQRMLPHIGPEVAGGTYCAADGHVNALRLFGALHAFAEARGAAYWPNAQVKGVAHDGGAFRLETDAGSFEAGKVVLAAGLGNVALAPMLGLAAPLRPQRGQILVTERVAPFLDYPFGTLRQTDEGGVMMGDSLEEVGFDTGNRIAVLAGIADRAVRMFPLLARARIVRSWGALRVMSPDGHPIYDASQSHPGAFLVTCHSGITLAAAHARIVAAAIAGAGWDARLKAFSAGRLTHVPATA